MGREAGGVEATLHAALRKLWAETGDVISIQYTGTSMTQTKDGGDGVGGEPEKKKSVFGNLSGLLEKGAKVANRYVSETFMEDHRQISIDALLRATGEGTRKLSRRRKAAGSAAGAYTGPDPLNLFVGTFNVNGKICSDEDMRAWLSLGGGFVRDRSPEPPSACIVGFQEFVALDAKNILRDDEARKRECRVRLGRVLEAMHGEKYAELAVSIVSRRG